MLYVGAGTVLRWRSPRALSRDGLRCIRCKRSFGCMRVLSRWACWLRIGCCGFACGGAPRCFGLRPRRRLRLPQPCPRSRPRDFWAVSQEMGADFAMGLDFCAVFGGGCSLPAPPTWGNAGAGWRFGPIRPATPPRSCERGLRALKMTRLDMCSDSVGAGRHSCMNKRLKPAGVQAISRKLVWWRGECGHVYQIAVSDRVRAKPGYCPYCSGRKRPERPIRLD